MASSILETKIEQFAITLKKKHKYPSYVSGAEYNYCKIVAMSGDIDKTEFVKSLIIELSKFGNIGEKYKGSSIGFCAETISANKVLQRFPLNIDVLNVGRAIRPRTMQVGKRCKICKTIF